MGFDTPGEAILWISHDALLADSSKRACLNLCEVFSGVPFPLITNSLYGSSSIS
ncbi:MAG: hypothetical protein JW701_05320 [Kosmotogaceae bacterium]|nr:hypothetical protein [Kosmotogaceae bacterium]